MGSSTPLALSRETEELVAHLPVSGVTEYRKGKVIYGMGGLTTGIYLLVAGRVDVSRIGGDGRGVLMEIVRPDELFGESALLGAACSLERATAMERTKLMSWAACDLEGVLLERPRLAVALVQTLARRNAEFRCRIESLAIDSVKQRLVRSLLHFSERLGTPETNGGVRMMPITHAMLARYVGTSRELVTHYMNGLRKQGCVDYSRSGIMLYRDAFNGVLDGSMGAD